MRRLFVVLSLPFLAACAGMESEETVYDAAEAEALVVSLWGAEARGLSFDSERELDVEEVAMVSEEEGAADKKSVELEAGLALLESVGLPELVAEAQRLRPGKVMTACRTWTRRESEGGGTRRYVEIPEDEVRFLWLRRGEDEALLGELRQALDHEEARSGQAP